MEHEETIAEGASTTLEYNIAFGAPVITPDSLFDMFTFDTSVPWKIIVTPKPSYTPTEPPETNDINLSFTHWWKTVTKKLQLKVKRWAFLTDEQAETVSARNIPKDDVKWFDIVVDKWTSNEERVTWLMYDKFVLKRWERLWNRVRELYVDKSTWKMPNEWDIAMVVKVILALNSTFKPHERQKENITLKIPIDRIYKSWLVFNAENAVEYETVTYQGKPAKKAKKVPERDKPLYLQFPSQFASTP